MLIPIEECLRIINENRGVRVVNVRQVSPGVPYTADQIKQSFEDTGHTMSRYLGSIPLLGSPANMNAATRVDLNAGQGHPSVAKFFGREGVVGAASNNVDGITIKDVYTPKNIKTRFIQGAIVPSIVGGSIGGPVGAIAAGTIGGGLNATITPAINYGLGRANGRKYTRQSTREE